MSLQRRFVRTGFFRSDFDFTDPDKVLFAEPADEWRHSDGAGALTEAVLERCNVGMGLCILNREHLDSETVFGLYRRLRDLEVNSLKKFCCLTSRRRSTFSSGLSHSHILAFAETTQTSRKGVLPACALWLLQNAFELHAVVQSYSKPLVCLLNGRSEGDGAAICLLANRSAAYKHSSFVCDTTSMGFIPTLGLSFALGRLRGSLGAFLALTGHELRAQDLVWSGLCRYWVSPEALHFLEVTAEKQLEISEQDGKALLEEHFLDPPGDYSLDLWEEIIDDHFHHSTLEDVLHALDSTASGISSRQNLPSSLTPQRVATWAKAVASRIRQRSPLAQKLTLELLRRQKLLQQEILEDANITPHEWRSIKSMDAVLSSNVQDDSMKQILEAVDERLLMQALENEFRVAIRLICSSRDLIEGLRSRLLEHVPDLYSPPRWTDDADVPLEPFFDPLPAPSGPSGTDGLLPCEKISICADPYGLFTTSDFVADERTIFPFSAHPLVGRMTPGGAGAGLSERQQARLSTRWSWDIFRHVAKQEGFKLK
ncbi:3-hydroxyisobutyryl-CoA hydrolase, mitochondrial, related [Eimeria tenella]|uniref:3-hydroxyisobutyryl-CoA hydrolase n=1 Tax=Eimeria tenella TaxID=5802 RepID=U6KU59_EIMTE|nr:3-hydroxyisobutyryl-CoA hydrolase, mitochondrial, related [Eimeria tenella]CDJ41481.1 3-hydroxyisobutyryl-CoA hydrolase, mitochondrial, related [Eimeria tenella]|eukprot:XP_013232231.1 3-hydroxyisobutyryl-CoA hydrolase, mitochondrial, related [Eimeria tenella]